MYFILVKYSEQWIINYSLVQNISKLNLFLSDISEKFTCLCAQMKKSYISNQIRSIVHPVLHLHKNVSQ